MLYQADILAGQSVEMMTRNRANLERTIANTRDATDWADKLVQKLFANPFVLSPFYKPTPEDTRVQTVYDTAQVFTKGARIERHGENPRRHACPGAHAGAS